MVRISGGKAVALMMKNYGVKYVMGVPGGQTYPIYMGIQDEYPEMQHILFHCERCAAYAADAYARVSNKPGVCDGVPGPGGTHLVPGVAEAWGASIPLIVITSDIDTPFIGKNASQEADLIGAFKPFVKASFYFGRTDKIPEMVRRAFRIATSGRPGPVHLDFPYDVLRDEIEFGDNFYVEEEYGQFPAYRVPPDLDKVKEAAELILRSERPLMVAGGGAVTSQAWDEVRELAELLMIPVATTMMGKGSMPEDHPLSIGAITTSVEEGPCFLTRARKIVMEADLVIFIGSNTDDKTTFSWTIPKSGTKIIHIDIDPQEIGRNFRVTVGVVADAKLAVRAIIEALKTKIQTKPLRDMSRVEEIRKAVKEWRDSMEPKVSSNEVPINPNRVAMDTERATASIRNKTIMVCDSSFAAFFGAHIFNVASGRNFITYRGLAGIGTGLPGAIGAKLAAPSKYVVGLGGDGAFAYSVHELETLKRLGLPLVYVILNNSAFGAAALYVKRVFGKVISCHFTPVNYAKVAEAYACKGMRIEKSSEILGTIKEAIISDEPVIIDVETKLEGPFAGV